MESSLWLSRVQVPMLEVGHCLKWTRILARFFIVIEIVLINVVLQICIIFHNRSEFSNILHEAMCITMWYMHYVPQKHLPNVRSLFSVYFEGKILYQYGL
jgi:hypothetical protein